MLYEADLGQGIDKTARTGFRKFPIVRLNSVTNRADWSGFRGDGDGQRTRAPEFNFFRFKTSHKKTAGRTARIAKLARRALTGLPNRVFFMTRLEQALVEKSVEKIRIIKSACFLSTRPLLRSSTTASSNRRRVARRHRQLHECLRPPDLVARLGEASNLRFWSKADMKPGEVTTIIAERITRKKFAGASLIRADTKYSSSASIGIRTRRKIIDARRYDARRRHGNVKGRTGGQSAAPRGFDRYARRRQGNSSAIETDLRRAVENGLTVFYQPIYTPRTAKFEGFSAGIAGEIPNVGSRWLNLSARRGKSVDRRRLGEQILRRARQQGAGVLRAESADWRALFSQRKFISQTIFPTLFSQKHVKSDTTECQSACSTCGWKSPAFEHKEKSRRDV